jgi:phosphate-selective porin
MKKTIAITSALAAASSLATAEIKINEFLSFEGFVDMSYSHTNTETTPQGGQTANSHDNSFAIDQVEIDWMFNFGKVTAQVDLEYEDNAAQGNNTDVEQAFVSYDLGNGAALTMGRYESMLGLEDKEPTGLYQWSTAYDMGDLNTSALPDYAQGVKYTYEANGNFFGLSLQDKSNDNSNAATAGKLGQNSDGYGIEAAFSTELGDATTLFLGGVYEDANAGNTEVYNAYITHEVGAWTLGAEVILAESDQAVSSAISNLGLVNEEVLQGLIMANYAYSDCCSVTGRISYTEHDADAVTEAEALKYTLAHNYAVTDNLAVIMEVSYSETELTVSNSATDIDALQGAVEVLFSF